MVSVTACGDDESTADDDATTVASQPAATSVASAPASSSANGVVDQFPEDVRPLVADLPVPLQELLLDVRESGPGELIWANGGGEWEEAQRAAFKEEWEKITGWTVTNAAVGYDPAILDAQIESGRPEYSVFEFDYGLSEEFCADGRLEKLDFSVIPSVEAFPEFSGFGECFVDIGDWLTILLYNTDVFGDDPPTSIVDVFDTERFAGKRCLNRSAQYGGNFEVALMADGVAFEDVFAELRTDEGVERAIAKLESIKDDIVWYASPAESVQFVLDGHCDLGISFNNRVASLVKKDPDLPLAMVQDDGFVTATMALIPLGAPASDAARSAIGYFLTPQNMCDFFNENAVGVAIEMPPFPDCLSDFARAWGVNPALVAGARDAIDPGFFADRLGTLQDALVEVQSS